MSTGAFRPFRRERKPAGGFGCMAAHKHNVAVTVINGGLSSVGGRDFYAAKWSETLCRPNDCRESALTASNCRPLLGLLSRTDCRGRGRRCIITAAVDSLDAVHPSHRTAR